MSYSRKRWSKEVIFDIFLLAYLGPVSKVHSYFTLITHALTINKLRISKCTDFEDSWFEFIELFFILTRGYQPPQLFLYQVGRDLLCREYVIGVFFFSPSPSLQFEPMHHIEKWTTFFRFIGHTMPKIQLLILSDIQIIPQLLMKISLLRIYLFSIP